MKHSVCVYYCCIKYYIIYIYIEREREREREREKLVTYVEGQNLEDIYIYIKEEDSLTWS